MILVDPSIRPPPVVMTTHPLHLLFHPRNVAVIGASPDTGRIRGRIFEFLSKGEYRA